MSSTRIVKFIILVVVFGAVLVGFKFYSIYRKAYVFNINLPEDLKQTDLYVHSNWTYDSVFNYLKNNKLLKRPKDFDWTAKKKNYPNHINPGRYILKKRMSNNELINKLRSGEQDPVLVTFNNIRTLKELSQRLAEQIEPTADELYSGFTDTEIQKKYGFTTETIPAMFIPNTYEFYWNTSVNSFLKRMYSEYERFWTRSRLSKAEKADLTPVEVITLASIVDEETLKDDEKDKIAGVYINRMKIGMRLQADPTVIFALGDFSIRRVLNKHKSLDSPFNTYRNAGLPPGPICLPEISSIDAVLDYKKHKYLYFCAKSDFSGYHTFARTLSEHNKNARAYQRELNKRRIYR